MENLEDVGLLMYTIKRLKHLNCMTAEEQITSLAIKYYRNKIEHLEEAHCKCVTIKKNENEAYLKVMRFLED